MVSVVSVVSLALWALIAVVMAAWMVLTEFSWWRHGGATAVALACGGLAIRSLRRSPLGRLGWDGQAWTWSSPGGGREHGEVQPRLDFQSLMLLEFSSSAGAARWLWLEQSREPWRWGDLRRAVYSRAIHEVPLSPTPDSRADAAS